jgi:hypothetical protein
MLNAISAFMSAQGRPGSSRGNVVYCHQRLSASRQRNVPRQISTKTGTAQRLRHHRSEPRQNPRKRGAGFCSTPSEHRQRHGGGGAYTSARFLCSTTFGITSAARDRAGAIGFLFFFVFFFSLFSGVPAAQSPFGIIVSGTPGCDPSKGRLKPDAQSLSASSSAARMGRRLGASGHVCSNRLSASNVAALPARCFIPKACSTPFVHQRQAARCRRALVLEARSCSTPFGISSAARTRPGSIGCTCTAAHAFRHHSSAARRVAVRPATRLPTGSRSRFGIIVTGTFEATGSLTRLKTAHAFRHHRSGTVHRHQRLPCTACQPSASRQRPLDGPATTDTSRMTTPFESS